MTTAAAAHARPVDPPATPRPGRVYNFSAGPACMPESVLDQLREGGRIGAVFMEGALGVARVGYKIDGVVSWRQVFNAAAPVLPGFAAPRGFVL